MGSMGRDIIINYKENLALGDGSTFNDRCWINARFGITIGRNCLFGPNVLIHSANHVIKHIDIEQNANDKDSWCAGDRNKRIIGLPVTIGDDVWVGAGCIILAGSRIPDKCVIGAGTIITASNSALLREGDIVVNNVGLKVIGNRGDEKYKETP
jgi:acetyltransferase-like isoleucine patch superfamily enzyme